MRCFSPEFNGIFTLRYRVFQSLAPAVLPETPFVPISAQFRCTFSSQNTKYVRENGLRQ